MSPANGLDQRSQQRRGQVLLAAMALLAVGLGVWALTRDDGRAAETSAGGRPATGDDIGTTSANVPTSASDSVPVTASGPDPDPTVPSTTGAPPSCDPSVTVRGWDLRRRIASLVVVDPGNEVEARRLVTSEHIGGFFIGGASTDLLSNGVLPELRTEAAGGTGLIVAVDEEGGRVQRIDEIHGDMPSAREMAATMTEDQVRTTAERRAEQMTDLGISVDLAPVVDLTDTDEQPIGDRSYSPDPAIATSYAGAFAEGLRAAGIEPVLKHFPGHGSASGDTHTGAAETPSLDQLETSDLVPYRTLRDRLGADTAVMLGHLDVPGLTTGGVPASLSPEAVAYLRTDVGFTGVVMTDDLGAMVAVTSRYTHIEAATRALAAGVDLVLFNQIDVGPLLDGLERAVGAGELTEDRVDEAVVRVLAWKGLDPCAIRI